MTQRGATKEIEGDNEARQVGGRDGRMEGLNEAKLNESSSGLTDNNKE